RAWPRARRSAAAGRAAPRCPRYRRNPRCDPSVMRHVRPIVLPGLGGIADQLAVVAEHRDGVRVVPIHLAGDLACQRHAEARGLALGERVAPFRLAVDHVAEMVEAQALVALGTPGT